MVIKVDGCTKYNLAETEKPIKLVKYTSPMFSDVARNKY